MKNTSTKGPNWRRVTPDERTQLAERAASMYVDESKSVREISDAIACSYGFTHRLLTDSGVTLRSRGGNVRRRDGDAQSAQS